MPMVEAIVLIAVIVCGDQKFGVCAREEEHDREEPEPGRQLADLQEPSQARRP